MARRRRIISNLARLLATALLIQTTIATPIAFNQTAQERGQGTKPPVKNAAEPRVALVIGNSAYTDSPLPNPVNDAQDITATLKSVGFEVIPGEDLSQAGMIRAIDDFGQRLRHGGVGLFYFAGHGMQVKGDNYLIPVGARINKELDVEIEAVKLARVLNEMDEAKNRLNIVILDACRNNPFARSFRSGRNGLGVVDAPTGTLIAYATQPGNTASDGSGRNGLYTQELLAAIRAPGLKVEDVFKRVRSQVRSKSSGNQVPWENSSLEGDFYFVPSTTSAPAPVAESPQEKPNANPIQNAASTDTGSWAVVANKTVRLEANQSWADSGLQIKPGQQLTIRTGGQINLGALGYAGPGGVSKTDARKPMSDCPTGALIARLDNEMICIESERDFTAKSGGKLWLGLNENNLADNLGAWIVKVVVQEFRR
ncbi:MAG: caspase domain-containing protein [Acidobacteriota bacterium]